jgi:predicted GNAT family acetyltransferase
MIELVRLTRPGPFGKKTIDFGYYHGIFDDNRLVAMTGQRLHVEKHTELSAVCTHPDYLGKGYATALMQHQMQIILRNGQKPFLHVRDDNDRAIAVYERLGFVVSRPMYFYFLIRK